MFPYLKFTEHKIFTTTGQKHYYLIIGNLITGEKDVFRLFLFIFILG